MNIKTKSLKQIKREEVRNQLLSLGYEAPMIMLTREMLYRVIVILINHLAYVLDRHAYRVYFAALCRAERTKLGTPYSSYKQARPPEGHFLDGIECFCPKCGADLLEGGPLSKDEVINKMKRKAMTFREYHGRPEEPFPYEKIHKINRNSPPITENNT